MGAMRMLVLESSLGDGKLGDWARVLVPKFCFLVVTLKYMRETLVFAKIWNGGFLCFKPLVMSHERLGARLLFFSKRFADHAPYYQFVVWLRQILIFVVIIVVRGNVITGILAALIVLGSLVVHQRVRPFVHDFQNLAESCMLGSALILLIFATFYTAFFEEIPAGFQIIFSVLIILVGTIILLGSIFYLRLHQALFASFKAMLLSSKDKSSEGIEGGAIGSDNVELLKDNHRNKNSWGANIEISN